MTIEQELPISSATHDMETKKPIIFEKNVLTYVIPGGVTASYFFGLILKTFDVQAQAPSRLSDDGQMLPVHKPAAPDGVWVREKPQLKRIKYLISNLFHLIDKKVVPVDEIYSVARGTVNNPEDGHELVTVKRRYKVTTTSGRFIHEQTYCFWQALDPINRL